MSKALEDICSERKRQIEVEGWTPEHDDKYSRDEIAHAAVCYILSETKQPAAAKGINWFNILWPWHYTWWKPKNRRRNLVKAAALIAAEIDRLDRNGD